MQEELVSALSLNEFLPYRLNNIAERLGAELSRIYQIEFGINLAEWRVLAVLHAQKTTLARDIAAYTRMDKVRVSRAVANLEEQGYISKQPSPSDSRATELRLRRKGKRLYAALVPRALTWQEGLLTGLSDDDKNELSRLLTLLEAGLQPATR